MTTPLDAETALTLSELVGQEAYNRIVENQIQPHQFPRLTHSEWAELGIPIGIRHRIIDLVEPMPPKVDPRDQRRASLLGGTPPTPTSSSSSLASTSSAPPPSSTPETAAQGFTFKEALATVPLFSGSPEEDIVSWLQEIMTLVGDSGMAAKVARSKLAGKPKEWLASLKSPIPATAAGWEILSMSLKSLYCDPLRTRSALEELKSLQWLPFSSITDHCISIVTLLEKAEIHDEAARIDHLINSVPPSARQFLILSDVTTMEDAIQKLKLWERTTEFTPNHGPPSTNASFSGSPHPPPVRRCFICQDSTHLANFHRRPPARSPHGRQGTSRPTCSLHANPRDCNGCRMPGHKGHCDAICMMQHPELRPPPRVNAAQTHDPAAGPELTTDPALRSALLELLNRLQSSYSSRNLIHPENPQTGYPSPNPNTLLHHSIFAPAPALPSPEQPPASITTNEPPITSVASPSFRPLPMCSVQVAQTPSSALIDSGSQICIIRRALAELVGLAISPSSVATFKGVDGNEVASLGEVTCAVTVGRLTRTLRLVVAETSPAPILLGVDAIENFGLILNLRQRTITLEDGSVIKLNSPGIVAVCAVSTLLPPHGVISLQLARGPIPNSSNLYFDGYCSENIFIPPGIINPSDPRVLAVNCKSQPYLIKAGRELNHIEICSMSPETAPIILQTPPVPTTTPVHPQIPTESGARALLERVKFGPNLSASMRQRYRDLIVEFADVFEPISGSALLPPMPIELTDEHPVVSRPQSKEPFRHTPWLKDTINQMLGSGIIRYSNSAFHSPVVIVKKPHGRGWRLCVDYRALNSKTKPIYTVLPDPENILATVKGFKRMSSLDLTSGFWQLSIVPEHSERTAFSTSFGVFEYLAAPMGLRNVPHYFNRAITSLFKQEIDLGFLKTYFDDLNAFSSDDTSHLAHLQQILAKCRSHCIKVNPEKTLIAFEEGPCLGFTISGETIRPGAEKAQAILNMPPPTNVNEIRVFMGLVNFYRRFLPDLSRVAAPLTNLTKKDTPFTWEAPHQAAFSHIQTLISSDIALHHFDPSSPTSVTSDASEQGWAAALRQDDKVIAFASGRFTAAQSKYAPHERECLGALSGLEKFRHYLLGGPVTLYTDSRAISWLQKSRELSPKLFRWSLRLQEFSPEIVHREGSAIPFEDCGSRLPSPDLNPAVDLPSPLEAPPAVAVIYSSRFPPSHIVPATMS